MILSPVGAENARLLNLSSQVLSAVINRDERQGLSQFNLIILLIEVLLYLCLHFNICVRTAYSSSWSQA